MKIYTWFIILNNSCNKKNILTIILLNIHESKTDKKKK